MLMTTEDPTPGSVVRHEPGQVVILHNGLILREGLTLHLSTGEYFYDDAWARPHQLIFTITWIGRTFLVRGRQFVYLEGHQHIHDLTRPRAIAVRLSALLKIITLAADDAPQAAQD